MATMNVRAEETVGLTEDTLKKVAVPKPDRVFGQRHLQVLLMFLGLTLAYTLRINVSVAIVAMVDKNAANPDFPEYEWDTKTQSLILSSFYWGYILTLLPSGPLCDRFGAKVLLLVAIGSSSLLALLTPVAASWEWRMVCALRVVQGLVQGVISPCLFTLLASWAPVTERGRLATYTNSGAVAGTVIALSSSGLLSASAWGWPSTFYVFGVGGVLWCILWIVFASNTPADNRFMPSDERLYIEDTTTVTTPDELQAGKTTKKYHRRRRKTPWMAMLTSPPVWGIIVAQCGQFWGFWTLLVEMPTFMKTVLHFEIKANGFLSALPYLGQWICSFFSAWLSDFIHTKEFIRPVTSRRVFNTFGHWGPAFAMIGLGYTNQATAGVAVTLLVLAVSINSATYVSFMLSHIDLTPNYAGTLMGITNTAANLMSLLGPLLVGGIVTKEGSSEQWRIVFFVTSALMFTFNILYVVLIRADVQPWNETPKTTADEEVNINS